jgi:hypothetical protein
MQDFKPTDTIKVVADTTLGFMIIDASDFDEAEHQIYEEPKPKDAAKPATKA